MVDLLKVSSTLIHSHRPSRWGARIARIAGFGGLLAILAAEGFYSLKIAWQIQVSNTEMRRGFLSRDRTLEKIRSALYESGNVVRDYILVEPGEDKAETLRTELKTIRDDMETALRVYSLSLRPEERGPFQQLATEVETYWSSLEPIFNWDAKARRNRGNGVGVLLPLGPLSCVSISPDEVPMGLWNRMFGKKNVASVPVQAPQRQAVPQSAPSIVNPQSTGPAEAKL